MPAEPSKGERTKQRILDAALELFRRDGYEATTMRTVAEKAGVALGNAYYYFASKDQLLEAFYHEVHLAHLAASGPALAGGGTLEARLRGVLLAKLEVIEPYHHFSALLFRTAADPRNPMNPFHPAGEATRREGEQLFAETLRGTRLPKDLAAELPGLLWTYHMGIVLFWIHDDSNHRIRTRKLIAHSTGIVARCIKLAANPLLAPLRRRVMAMLRDLAANTG